MADVDVISDLLKACIDAFPQSGFVQGLSHQYLVRGWLTKKQLEGLWHKASELSNIAPGKLATLQAQIQRMPTRYRSAKPPLQPAEPANDSSLNIIKAILTKYPQHKRVLYLHTRIQARHPLSAAEKAELERLHKALFKA